MKPNTFNISAPQPMFATFPNGTMVVESYGDPIPFIRHDEVCKPLYMADGRCPRAVVSHITSNGLLMLTLAMPTGESSGFAALQEALFWLFFWTYNCTSSR